MTNPDLVGDAVTLVREAARILDDPKTDPQTESFARASLRFAARVFDLYVNTERPAKAIITAAPQPSDHSVRSVSERRTAHHRHKGTPTLRVKPEAYVTPEAVAHVLSFETSPERSPHDTYRCSWGRRADCFLAVVALTARGEVASPTAVAKYIGMKPNNASTRLTDLTVHDVLRRHTDGSGHAYYVLSNWSRKRLS